MDVNKPQNQLHCKRCGGTWDGTRTPNPTACPCCKSPLWNRDRILKKGKNKHGNIYQGRTRQDCHPEV